MNTELRCFAGLDCVNFTRTKMFYIKFSESSRVMVPRRGGGGGRRERKPEREQEQLYRKEEGKINTGIITEIRKEEQLEETRCIRPVEQQRRHKVQRK
jgi:hypothetical protein